MDRRLLLILALVGAILPLRAQGQEENSPPPPPLAPPPGLDGPDFKKRFPRLSPEQQQHMLRNFKRWENLPPEQQERLKKQFEERHQRMLHEAEAAIQTLGLTLDGDKKEAFLKRYGELRRQLEEDLRKQMDEERRKRIPAIHEQLKKEFAP